MAHPRLRFPALILALGVLTGCRGGEEPPGDGLATLLPARVGEWLRREPVRTYDLEALYVHIDGAAQLYREFGFRMLRSAGYVHGGPEGVSAALDLFEMDDPSAAAGLFSCKRGSTGGLAVEAGEEAWLEGYFLNARQGAFLLTAVVPGAGALADPGRFEEALVALAREVLARLPAPAGVPELEPALPASGRIPGTSAWFRGPGGLNLALSDYPVPAPLPRRGATAVYREGSQEFRKACLDYANSEEAEEAMTLLADWPEEELSIQREEARLFLEFLPRAVGLEEPQAEDRDGR